MGVYPALLLEYLNIDYNEIPVAEFSDLGGALFTVKSSGQLVEVRCVLGNALILLIVVLFIAEVLQRSLLHLQRDLGLRNYSLSFSLVGLEQLEDLLGQ